MQWQYITALQASLKTSVCTSLSPALLNSPTCYTYKIVSCRCTCIVYPAPKVGTMQNWFLWKVDPIICYVSALTARKRTVHWMSRSPYVHVSLHSLSCEITQHCRFGMLLLQLWFKLEWVFQEKQFSFKWAELLAVSHLRGDVRELLSGRVNLEIPALQLRSEAHHW